MFAKTIKELRNKRGYTMQELGRLVGVAKTTVANWEAGGNGPQTETLIAMADLFGVSTDYLLGVEKKQLDNIAAIKLDPLAQSSIDRGSRMRDAGMTEAQIDEIVNFAVNMTTQKKQP